MKLFQIVFPKFKKLSHLKAILNFYLSFVKNSQGKTGYYYRALFSCENENSGKSFSVNLTHSCRTSSPYFIRTYLSFRFWKNSKKRELPFSKLSLKSAKIDLTIPENQEVKQLSEYINPEKFHKFGFLSKERQYISFERGISSQYVVS